MAVYTKIPDAELNAFVSRYAFGHLQKLEDILEGVENSNFFLTTDVGKFVLTLYEKRMKAEELPFFIALMRHLAAKGIPCPQPIADKAGNVIHTLAGRQAAVISFLHGRMTKAITPTHCAQVGTALASMHSALQDFAQTRANNLSLEGWERLICLCTAGADGVMPGLATLLQEELAFLQHHWPSPTLLPRGIIHADLFPDNVFFEGRNLCGLIDFYFACSDFLAYDLAICINAWCFSPAHVFEAEKAAAMVAAYEAVRPLSKAEKEALPLLLRGASLRFLLTRLYDWLHHPEGALVKPKDPLEYRAKLLFFRDHGASLFTRIA